MSVGGASPKRLNSIPFEVERFLILFKMAAFRSRPLPRAFCFAQIAILDEPRLTMWVGGAEYG